ncbi:GIY-YIG nuclease family protein [Natronobeatus ordinarius]|uniref:GIY-YIG nuclease family protein n=1 Tax=Natronobeatus ordinarius TaxID=2963433 RepID=UPI0020CC4A55|nr:GIY-YIG nuclease family protein [Natronobeatus ordinarius]
MTTGGTYVLEITVSHSITVEVGALGPLTFAADAYAYVGSAFGPGGFSRVDRHRELARGERDVRHWHVDYLLGQPATRLEAVVTVPGEDCECELASTLPGEPVAGFGASDCDCEAHLLELVDREAFHERCDRVGGGRSIEFDRSG